jgi:hypothetical protein
VIRIPEGAAVHWNATSVIRRMVIASTPNSPADGRRGNSDLTLYLDHGGFRELQDPVHFRRVGIQLGAVTWPHDGDIAPEMLISGKALMDLLWALCMTTAGNATTAPHVSTSQRSGGATSVTHWLALLHCGQPKDVTFSRKDNAEY